MLRKFCNCVHNWTGAEGAELMHKISIRLVSLLLGICFKPHTVLHINAFWVVLPLEGWLTQP